MNYWLAQCLLQQYDDVIINVLISKIFVLQKKNTGQQAINKLKASATRVFCREKNDRLHDGRRQEPPAPPKEVNVCDLQGELIHRTSVTFFLPDLLSLCL